jgi:hypothetical protein
MAPSSTPWWERKEAELQAHGAAAEVVAAAAGDDAAARGAAPGRGGILTLDQR